MQILQITNARLAIEFREMELALQAASFGKTATP